MNTIQISPRKLGYATVVREDVATDGSVIYLGEIPDLPGCMSHGDTPDEALQNLWEVAELYLEEQGAGGQDRPAVAISTTGTGFYGLGGVAIEAHDVVDAEIVFEPIEKVA